MASSYTGLGTELMTTGENAGTWGTTTNTNLQIIEQLSGGYIETAVTSTPTTLSVSDGSTGAALAHRIIKFTGTISEATTVTVPLDVQQMYILMNGTSGNYTLTFKYVTGSGDTVVFKGTDKGTKLVYATADDGTNPNMVDTGIASHQIHNTLTVGIDDTGYDVKLFGATAGSFALWDESADSLLLTDSTPLKIGDSQDLTLYHDGSNSYITNAVGALKLATETSGIAVTIGHTTSETTIADNLTTTGDTSVGGTLGVTGVATFATHVALGDSDILKLGAGTDLTLYHDGSNSYITNSQGALKVATETSGIAVTIGHTTSEVTIADNLTVTGTLTLGSNAELTEAELEFLDGITAGTAAASKALVLDSNKDIGTIRNLTIDGTFSDGNYTFDTSGNVTGLGTVASGNITSSGTVQGTTITATTAFVPDASDGAALGTSALEFSDLFLADEAVINFGDDQEVTLTHVQDAGLLLNSSNYLTFRDSALKISSSTDGQLDIDADTEVEITATTVDLNGILDVSGVIVAGGQISAADGTAGAPSISNTGDLNTGLYFSAADKLAFSSGGTAQVTFQDGAIVPVADDDIDLGTASLQFKDVYIDGTLEADAITIGGSAVVSSPITALNNATANELVTVGATTTELEAEANLTFDGTDVLVGGAGKLQLRDTALFINSSTDGQLDIDADTEVEITATTVDLNGALDVSGNSQFSGTVTVGVNDTGKDVKLFGATSGSYWLWDESADGVVQIGTLTVGVDDAGHDVKFFGDAASAFMLWDASTDDLVLGGAAKLYLYDAAGGEHISSDGSTLSIAGGGEIDLTATAIDINGTCDISGTFSLAGTNVTSTAAEINYSDLATLGTSAASKVLSADSNNLTKITGGVYLEEDTLSFDATQDWDVRASPVAQVTLTANVTFDLPSNPTTGQYISILCIQDGTGSRTIAWNAAFEFTGGTAPTATTTAGKGDLFTFRYHNSHWVEVGRNLNLTRA